MSWTRQQHLFFLNWQLTGYLLISATSDESTEKGEETEASDDVRALLTTTRERPDASMKLIRTHRVATTVPENAKTATPVGETTANGIETVAIAGAENTMKDLPDATETGTLSMAVDPDGTGEETAIANVTVTMNGSGRGEEETGRGPRLLRLGKGRVLLI